MGSGVALAWSPDGARIASAGPGGRLFLWEADGTLVAAADSPRVEWLSWLDGLHSFANSRVWRWDTRAMKRERRLKVSHATAAAHAPGGRLVAIGTGKGEIEIWDLETEQRIAEHPVFDSGQAITVMVWSPTWGHIACAAETDDPIALLDLETNEAWRARHGTVHFSESGDPFGFPDGERQAAVTDFAFTPDGQHLVSVGEGDQARIWNLRGVCMREVPANGWTKASAVDVSPDGERVAFVDHRGAVHLFDLGGEGDALVVETGADDLRAVAFSPNGAALAVSADGSSIRVLDARTGERRADQPDTGPKEDHWAESAALAVGPLAIGDFRVVVLEASGSVSHADYDELGDARQHADDAASESDPVEPVAAILDCQFRRVGRGRHYAVRQQGAWLWELAEGADEWVLLSNGVDYSRLLEYNRRTGESRERPMQEADVLATGRYGSGPVGWFASPDGPVFFDGDLRFLLNRDRSRISLYHSAHGETFELWQEDELAHQDFYEHRRAPADVIRLYAVLAEEIYHETFYILATDEPEPQSRSRSKPEAVSAQPGDYLTVLDGDGGDYPEVYRLLGELDNPSTSYLHGCSGFVRVGRADLLLECLKVAYPAPRYQVAARGFDAQVVARPGPKAERPTVPGYLFATPDERDFPERYRVLQPGEQISDVGSELAQMTGVLSPGVDRAYEEALRTAHAGTGMSIGRANGSDWSAVENGYYGLGLDYDHFFDD